MKHLALIVALCSLSVGWISAQDWVLLQATESMDQFESDVSEFVLEGYLPVGLDVSTETGMSVLLVRTPDYRSTGWRIEEATSPEDATAEFTELMRAGYLLMDVSLRGESVIGLFSLTPAVVSGWRIVPTPKSFMDATRTVAEYAANGFTAWGVSADAAVLHHLLLRIDTTVPMETQVIGFEDDDTFESAMTAVIADGWLPWGLARDDGETLVRFIRAVE